MILVALAFDKIYLYI